MAKEKSICGYYDFTGAGYQDANIVADLTVGLYYKSGGCDCEFGLELKKFQNDEHCWGLKLWADSWKFLPRFQKLLDNLSAAQKKLEKKPNPYLRHRHLSKDEIEAILAKSGFKKMKRSV